MLIADEVGLGKTIEAALIFRELSARHDMKRVLIVCPAGLREKWYGELRNRFDEEFDILSATAFRRFLHDHRELGDAARLRGICSLEMLRSAEFPNELTDQPVQFDLVIIDEAHHLRNPATLSFALGSILSNQSRAFVLLSATPLQTGTDDLFNLLRLISVGDFSSFPEFAERIRPNEFINQAARFVDQGDFSQALSALRAVESTPYGRIYPRNPRYRSVVEVLGRTGAPTDKDIVSVGRDLLELNTLARVFNRTKKKDVHPNTAVRTPFKILVEFSPEERAFYDAVNDFVRWQHTEQQESSGVPIFTVIMRERQAASCIQSLKAQFEKGLESRRIELDLEASDPDISDEDVLSRWLDLGRKYEKTRVTTLLSLCEAMGDRDTKFERFEDTLRNLLDEDPDCKALVFTFFKGTAEYLLKRLSQGGVSAQTIHGGIPPEERQRRIDEFRNRDDVRIMVSTEVGAEGLDFEFCGALFNYDLPWNPMRVEQRIGRIDRLGQHHKRILIYNMVIDDTIETRIFDRLYTRIRLFESSIGALEPILGKVVKANFLATFLGQRLTAERGSAKSRGS